MRERTKVGIVYHALEKFLIFASARRLARKKKIVQSDRGSAERVGLDDIGAGFEVLRVNFLDNPWLGEKEQLETAFEVFSLPISKPFPPIIGLGQLVALNHCAHRAVEHDDAFAQERFQRMKVRRHDCPGTKRRLLP